MAEETGKFHFSGDVTGTTAVTVNKKGGSHTAILKRGLVEGLGGPVRALDATTIPFSNGAAVMMVAAPEHMPPGSVVSVHELSPTRFELRLQQEEEEPIDEITQAFLTLKLAHFRAGVLDLTPPVSAAAYRAELEDKLKPAAAPAESQVAQTE